MKNTVKRKNDSVEVITSLQSEGKVTNKATARQEVLYLMVKNSEAIASGTVKSLINNDTKIQAGISSFENEKFGRYAVIHGIRVRGNTTPYTGEGSADPKDADFATNSIPVAMRNCVLKITQGNRLLFQAPIRSLTAQANATDNGADEYEFDKPLLFAPDEKVEFVTESPTGASVPTAGYFLIELSSTLVLEPSQIP